MTAKQKPITKNDQIKKLYEEGLSIAKIAEKLGVRYQRVYNTVNVKAKPKQIQSKPKEG